MTSTPIQSRGSRKKPIGVRFFAFLAVTLLTPVVFAQSLTEADFVQLALARSDLATHRAALVDETRANEVPGSSWRGPEFEVGREQFEAASTTEVSLSQAIPLTGRRGLVKAADKEAEAHEERLQQARIVQASRARDQFWSARALELHIDAQERWIESLSAVAATMKQRVESGESAPYLLGRLERELVEAQTSVDSWNADLAALKAGLAVELGVDVGRFETLGGDLLPGNDEAGSARLPSLAALAAELEAVQLRLGVARRLWIPALRLTGGYINETAAGVSEHGFTAAIGIELPLSDQTSAPVGREQARRARIESELAIVQRDVDARVARLRVLASSRRTIAARYAEDATPRAAQLAKVSQLAFDAGEIGILEYLDSHRGVIDTDHRIIELAAQARLAKIDLQAALGVEQ